MFKSDHILCISASMAEIHIECLPDQVTIFHKNERLIVRSAVTFNLQVFYPTVGSFRASEKNMLLKL